MVTTWWSIACWSFLLFNFFFYKRALRWPQWHLKLQTRGEHKNLRAAWAIKPTGAPTQTGDLTPLKHRHLAWGPESSTASQNTTWLNNSTATKSTVTNLVAEKISSNFCFRAFPSLKGQLESSWWQKMTLFSTALETPRQLIISRSISAHLELRLTFSPCLQSWESGLSVKQPLEVPPLLFNPCLLYKSPSPRAAHESRMA